MNEEAGEDDELFLIDEHGETRLSGYVGPNFENNLRVPLLEILKYPYLLLHEKVSTYLIPLGREWWCSAEGGENKQLNQSINVYIYFDTKYKFFVSLDVNSYYNCVFTPFR